MANNCSVNIKPDKLPITIKKVEYYFFRAAERAGISYLQLADVDVDVKLNLLQSARQLLEADMTNYAKKAVKLGETPEGKAYADFAANLQGVNANWDEATAYFTKYNGGLINLKTKFKMDDMGLIDLDATSDEEESLLAKFVFDQPANEIDPVDNIDKGIELFLRSIKREGVYDDYGFNVLVDYGSFVRRLSTDLENTLTIDEIVSRLETLKETTPEYQYIIDKLKVSPTDTATDIQFKINFRNSFAKALVPIYITSLENGIVKVVEATVAKRSLYEQIVNSNFFRRGMSVKVNGKTSNLAHQENGVWVLTKEDLPKLKRFMDEKSIPAGEQTERRIQFLEALGFEFSPESRALLFKVKNLNNVVNYIYTHIVRGLEAGDKIKDPIKAISKTVFLNGKKYRGQKGNINIITEFELKYNRSFNVERSIVNQDGNRQHAIQNHNNFTVVNKYLSDPTTYPTLQSIITAEPSLFWLDPVANPSVANSLYLNSLFFYDSTDPNFGARRRVTSDKKFSATEGEFVTISIVNTGGVQIKDEGGLKVDSASSTSLEAADKLIQDINMFLSRGFTSVQRLSDKSTDLGISLNYYVDPVTGLPTNRILSSTGEYSNIYNTEQFIESTMNALRDVMKMKYLANKGFYDDLSVASKTIKSKNNFGVFDSVISFENKELLNAFINSVQSVDEIDNIFLANSDEREIILADIQDYMQEYTDRFKAILEPVTSLVPSANLFGLDPSGKARNINDVVNYYLANTFLSDIENLKVFFGDAIFFKAFHKRSSKDSATGIFTTMENYLIDKLNDHSDAQGYGANTNLSGRMFIDRMYTQGLVNKDQRDQALVKQQVTKTFRSAVISDVNFNSDYNKQIRDNIERLRSEGYISDANYKLYKDNIEKVISASYKGVEADGQGKCTFDFYRIMSILTSNWSDKHEEVYKKIVMFSHYQDLIQAEQDEAKRAEYVVLRDAIGYNPLEDVYFPPKKFQYSGPMEYMKAVNGETFGQMVPVFDKFSLQPLIPTIIKGTADEQLAKRMEFNGVGYVKFESGSKVETPTNKDDYYAEYNESTPGNRKIFTVEQLLEKNKVSFKSEQTLFFTHLKEQVRIDSDIHNDSIFGSQIRKILLSNILGTDTTFNREEFVRLYDKYTSLTNSLIRIEKRDLYGKMGIKESGDRVLSVSNINKLIEFFFTEIDKKNQDSNVRKALKYNETTGDFEIPLDGAVQAQVIEGIVISSINNRIVRYHTNGSMLTQVAITGSERVKFSKEKSKEALETFGNKELKYYEVVEEGGKMVVKPMQVKIGLTGKWKSLLSLTHPDGSKIESLERLNAALKNEDWKKQNKKSITFGGYRIPTQGLNFADVMEVSEFLPTAFGDAIILPSEIVIKNGSDFDIDKMFVFYPNLVQEGDDTGKPVSDGGKQSVENQLFDTIFDIVLHPSNYMQLVTPSTNYHIEPLVDEIYKILYQKPRTQTDYKNTQLVDRDYNIRKFLSLLKGKSDLGIAAIANTFNVLYQLSNATASGQYLKDAKLKSFFSVDTMEKLPDNMITGISFGEIYDEDGVYKSEFFSEFINAFVDVAKDDYVFAVNVVTELSPIMFYMKYMGLSSKKILSFVNQPAIRSYIKNLSKFQNMTVKSYLESEAKKIEKELRTAGQDAQENEKLKLLVERLNKLKYSTRRKALSKTLSEFGFAGVRPFRTAMFNKLTEKRSITAYNKFYTSDNIIKLIKPDTFKLADLSDDMKTIQLSMLYELENLKIQSDSMTEAQRFLNFDTKPYKSTFDAYLRNNKYVKAKEGGNILSINTIDTIKSLSPIAPLNVAREIITLLESLLPIRNDRAFNTFILSEAVALKSDFEVQAIRSEDDMMTFARVYKNDLMSYILYNYLDKSTAGKEFFQKEFDTTKSFAEYMKELVETPKLLEQFNNLKDMDPQELRALVKQYPFIQNIVPKPGDKNPRIVSFKLVENSSHSVDRESVISQFEDVVNLSSEENKDIRMFFRNLALYSTFQSGYNYGEFSYIAVTPQSLINRLYGEAVKEFEKLSSEDKKEAFNKFSSLFMKNNPIYFSEPMPTLTKESSKRGKWYSEQLSLDFAQKAAPLPTAVPTTEEDMFKMADKLPPIEQNFADGVAGRVMQSQFRGKSTMDLVISGDRTRTTRAKTEVARFLKDYGLAKVSDLKGKIIRMTDTKGRMVYAKITNVAQFTQEYQDKTWKKEGWEKEVTDKLVGKYPYAIEFEVVKKLTPSSEQSLPDTTASDIENKINAWVAKELPWTLETPASELAKQYKEQQLTGETIEEFLHRMSCLGKLK